MKGLSQHIEALVFCAPEPLNEKVLEETLESVYGERLAPALLQEHLRVLEDKYQQEEYAFAFAKVGGGYQFLTKPAYHPSIALLLKGAEKKRLSPIVLETLAIVAYEQPTTKAAIDHIRGVNSEYGLQKLLELGLIAIDGKSALPGQPLLYKTTTVCLDHLGLCDLNELPSLPASEETAAPQEKEHS